MGQLSSKPTTVLVVGATGSVGQYAVAESIAQGYTTRALVRSGSSTSRIAKGAQIVVGDLTKAETLTDALADVDAVVFTHGASYGDAGASEAVDYGAVKNVLQALDGRKVRIALMSSIGVTVTGGTHDWKRRGERLVRASGNSYTIVRPGWFDYNADDQLAITLLQGDTRRAGSPADGVIARHQIARVLIDSLSAPQSQRLTVELVAEYGPAPEDLGPIFAALDQDLASSVDGIRDPENMPLSKESASVRQDLERIQGHVA
ncbi:MULTISPECIES: SDR family oxidoreductase [Micrococcaceae]|uniref:SDR family oxidoreductase n=1 Tax=Micrococcaceae TaxID=1268 RepID=UPI001035E17B|nr:MULTISPECIES: SDR family oxidoreductase [Micrococcaceae]TAP28477.1 SDR family oxidoreductase [Arthrobacter sp. S41]UXN32734.1 SDR family oxidoreductase [Glutamicibacter sp. M10]